MRAFLSKLFGFILMALVIVASLEWVSRQRFNEQSDFFVKLDDYKKIAPNISTLIIGPSNGEFGVNTEEFQNRAYNFCYSAQNFYYSRHLLEKIGPLAKQLKQVVFVFPIMAIGFNMQNLAKDRAYDYWRHLNIEPENGFDHSFFLQALSLARHRRRFATWPFEQIQPRFSHANLSGRGIEGSYNLIADGYRWVNFDFKAKNTLAAAKADIRRHFIYSYNKKTAEQSFAHLQEMIHWTRLRSLKFIVVLPPVHKDYYANIPQKISNRVFQVLDRHAAKNSHVEIVDYSTMSLSKDHFWDSFHLNHRGAKAFSTALAKDFNL